MDLPNRAPSPDRAPVDDPSTDESTDESTEAELDRLLARLRAELGSAGSDLVHLAHVRLLRLELGARRLVRSSFTLLATRLCVLLLALFAAGLVLLGGVEAVAELAGGRLWVGRLIAGSLALVGALLFLRSSGPDVEELRQRLSSTAPRQGEAPERESA